MPARPRRNAMYDGAKRMSDLFSYEVAQISIIYPLLRASVA